MRELAKSMFRFSWAMSVFGLEQIGKIVGDKEEDEDREHKITSSFNRVSNATGEDFSGRYRRLYESGDELQTEIVDAFFDMFSSDNWSAEKMLDRAADVASSSADALRKAAKKDEASDDEEATGATPSEE